MPKKPVRSIDPVYEFDKLPPSALVDIHTIMALAGVSRATVYRHAKTGTLPKPVQLGPQAVRWTVAEVRKYLKGTEE
jgi:predicted DNA-binding transcriptional regulator AlpA